ncbi:hypothetical protein B0T24DRAFT_312883 [Lasiosphaeria ovina]|uniref:Uncharacterized protein n=1 Tax=Lasiosphaeria ovina TaxID=92902 RepID=A0AAE0K8A6_9PEZI|nr:hypothetical protein B0T24DRAFT_312883 [Lasiosphaeria ovina]
MEVFFFSLLNLGGKPGHLFFHALLGFSRPSLLAWLAVILSPFVLRHHLMVTLAHFRLTHYGGPGETRACASVCVCVCVCVCVEGVARFRVLGGLWSLLFFFSDEKKKTPIVSRALSLSLSFFLSFCVCVCGSLVTISSSLC